MTRRSLKRMKVSQDADDDHGPLPGLDSQSDEFSEFDSFSDNDSEGPPMYEGASQLVETRQFHRAQIKELPKDRTEQASKLNAKPKVISRTPKMNNDIALATPYTNGIYRSNFFKLQTDELLQQIKPKIIRIEAAVDKLLRDLKSALEQIPDRQSVPIAIAKKKLAQDSKIKIPFPDTKLQVDESYQLPFESPSHINVIGSYSLRTMTKATSEETVDLALRMPVSLFQTKDYLNHRYAYKRAYFLACIAAGLVSRKDLVAKMHFDYLHGNRLAPILVLTPSTDTSDKLSSVRVRICPMIEAMMFPREKLAPWSNCLRSEAPHPSAKKNSPSPFYNGSVLQDSAVNHFLKLQHDAATECDAFRDACVLGWTWLKQRGFGSAVQAGGFGKFELTAMTALLLHGGGPKGMPVFSRGYSSYQLFKALLQFLSTRDLTKAPLVVGSHCLSMPKPQPGPVLIDVTSGHNVLFKMTDWSFQLLQFEAKASVAALNDSRFDQFDATFIMRSDNLMCRWDAMVEIRIGDALAVSSMTRKIREVLQRALTDRVHLIGVSSDGTTPWALSDGAPCESRTLIFGFEFDSNQIHRTIDRGPLAEDKKSAHQFQKFWGDKAELRRFNDGGIQESVIWDAHTGDTVFRQILDFCLTRHFENKIKWSHIDIGVPKLAAGNVELGSTAAPFKPLTTLFQDLRNRLQNLEGMPLYLRALHPSNPQLSSTSIEMPYLADRIRMQRPADGVLRFESSAKWPDDMGAIQKTKAAFLLKLGELLESNADDLHCRVGLENEDRPMMNRVFIDVLYHSGAAVRLRLHHDREETLLNRRLSDKALSAPEKLEIGLALATYRRTFIRLPAHTQAIQGLALRYPAFSATVRLVKYWFTSHMLSQHISEPLMELFVARTFTNPCPWTAPTSGNTGLLRTLVFLSRWDWSTDPWVVDMGTDDLSSAEIDAIVTRYEAWRKIDPAMNRVVIFAASNADHDGTTWTDYASPPKVVAGRMTNLAKAAVAALKNEGLKCNAESLFDSSLDDYDILIHLNEKHTTPDSRKTQTTGFKNLEVNGSTRKIEGIGFDPIALFLQDLKRLFGEALVFFLNDHNPVVIAAFWNPQTRRQWKPIMQYSTVSAGKADEVDVNRSSVLNDIARLGGDLVSKIEVKGKR